MTNLVPSYFLISNVLPTCILPPRNKEFAIESFSSQKLHLPDYFFHREMEPIKKCFSLDTFSRLETLTTVYPDGLPAH